ncbi:HET-domain-containing protein [Ophiobolus disseminans]|uniref:HET-domain-containing protein n=1 Tax=Ophiobolus disseminans TaxID=1469910 RepID=A0A6A7A131_9PLEO|nr:HET-domain-containing protein [Ophiobolus disseminans]
MPPYQYKPLNLDTGEIRLVELLPGAFDDEIRISIVTRPFTPLPARPPFDDRLEKVRKTLPQGWGAYKTREGRIIYDDGPTTTYSHPDTHYGGPSYDDDRHALEEVELIFEALSYTWGSEANQVAIEVVPTADEYRQESSKNADTLLVWSNLHDALKHLRGTTDSLILWIDAISINQGDLEERSQQVSRMGDIFRSARNVVVWLGLASDDSSSALRFFGHLGDQIEHTEDDFRLPLPDCANPNWYGITDGAQFASDPEMWEAIHKLLSRPWFDRVWIIQEIVLATSAIVQCGQDTILWRQLRSAIRTLYKVTFPAGSPPSLHELVKRRCFLANITRGKSVLFQLVAVKRAKYTLPHDLVFSILGLLPPVISKKIQPQYSTSPREVFRDAVIAFIDGAGSLDILQFSYLSWIPDFQINMRYFGSGTHRCSGQSTADWSYVDECLLVTTGVAFDTIEAVSCLLLDDDGVILKQIQKIWLSGGSEGQRYPNGDSLSEACARVMGQSKSRDYWPQTSYPTLADIQTPYQRMIQGGLDQDYRQEPALYRPGLDYFKLFKTTLGYFGVCFRTVKPGDTISVLLGCSLPTIIRQQSDVQHRFIGCSYIHGLLAGEALLGDLPDGWKTVGHLDTYGDFHERFIDPANPSVFSEDPRLGPLPSDWIRVVAPDRQWPSKKVNAFQNTVTGQILHSDPRMLSDALRARGVPLKEFRLVDTPR